METSEHKEAERFLEEFRQIDFQVPLESMKRDVIQVAGKKYYKDLYIVGKLLPAVIEGLEQLSRQVQILMTDQQSVDPQVRKRFNPCIFLAQYLMRHNHNLASQGQQTSLSKLFHNYCQVENFNRFFIKRHESIFKTFVNCIKKEKKVCDYSELKLYAKELDSMLGLKGALIEYLSNSKALQKNKSEIRFNDIVEEIARFASLNRMDEKQFEKIFAEK